MVTAKKVSLSVAPIWSKFAPKWSKFIQNYGLLEIYFPCKVSFLVQWFSAQRLNNVTSEIPGRNQCQDSAQYASNCPGWKWACTDPKYASFMQTNCKESCGLCSGNSDTLK